MLIQGNAAAIPLRDGSVQTVVTSPPYWGLRDYGVDGQLGLERTPEQYVASMVSVFAEVWRVLRDDGTVWVNLGDTYATGAGKVGDHPGGGAQGARYRGDHGKDPKSAGIGPQTQPNRMPIDGLKPKDLVGIPWRVAFALQAAGWYLRSDIIWSKPNPMPESVTDRPTKAHEYLFLLAKSERYYFDQDAVKEPITEISTQRYAGGPMTIARQFLGSPTDKRYRDTGGKKIDGASLPTARNIRTVWTVPTAPFSGAHFATFPKNLIKPCILAGAPVGGVVLDPFSGSGTTIEVAQDLGRIGIGVELKAEYLSIAQRRTAQQGLMLG